MSDAGNGAGAGPAALAMYDWPEIRTETDALWAALARALRDEGLDPPKVLERQRELFSLWSDPDLLLAQTCGLPYVRHLAGRVTLVGAPAYRLDGCAPGQYRSALVVREDDLSEGIAAFRGRRVAFNHPGSQSGEGALRHLVAPLSEEGRFFSQALEAGSHRDALRAVADGAADIACLDAVSWELAKRHEPAAASVRVLAYTPPTPGLPLISAVGRAADLPRIRRGVAQGIAALDPGIREALLLAGFVAFEPRDYEVIRERDRKAAALGYGCLA
ncbi:phosphate/phosphite/phosphonate ABC transporter substrate-binding protein [Stappia sp.]|uniref:phosphate/phosphite/phosphonate ABC transporter substrate-binding protein n=1 Tax=Stappia sp. TaxID=1870903 RepID=UPI003A993A0B